MKGKRKKESPVHVFIKTQKGKVSFIHLVHKYKQTGKMFIYAYYNLFKHTH